MKLTAVLAVIVAGAVGHAAVQQSASAQTTAPVQAQQAGSADQSQPGASNAAAEVGTPGQTPQAGSTATPDGAGSTAA